MQAERIAELLDAHAAALELYASRWTSAPEDCVQDVFVELAGQRAEPPNVAAWLFRATRNRALNATRGEQRRRRREEIVARLRYRESVPTSRHNVDSTAIQEGLRRLTPADHEVVILRIWSALTLEQTADVLGCSVATAHRKYQRALSQLKHILDGLPCGTTTCSPNNSTR